MIYCVEDDVSIRNLILYTLNASGFQAQGFSNSTEFWAAIEKAVPRIVLLDIMLPGEDGIDILKKLRSSPRTEDIPVILETAKGTEYDKVTGLDLGADDYLCKPFGMLEMVAHVRAILRRTASKREKRIRIGELTLNLAEHTAFVCEKRLQLTLKEYDLLQTFMENPGLVFTRGQLLSSIWGIDFMGESRTVDVHIGTLRTKLGICGEYIETVRGVGYRMEART